MIRILHTADIHIGTDAHGRINPEYRVPDRVLDYFDTLDAMIEYAVEHDADLAIIAGDSFHKPNPDPTLLRMFGERILRLSTQCTVVLLVGNHDMPEVVEKASAVDIFGTLQTPNVIVGNKFSVYHLEFHGERLSVATFPFPSRYRLFPQGELQHKNYDQINALRKQKISKILAALERRVSDNAILVGHFSIEGAVYGVEQDMMFGTDAHVPLSYVAKPVWKYVALGHIHGYQDVTEGMPDCPPVVYPGSIERVDFGEERQAKGFVWVELGERASYSFIELDARAYCSIEIDARGKRNQTEYVISKLLGKDIQDKIVRVTILGSRIRIRYDDVYAALNKAYDVKALNIIDEDTYHSTARTDDGTPFTSLTHEEMLREYLVDKGMIGKPLQKLLRIAANIMSDEEDLTWKEKRSQ